MQAGRVSIPGEGSWLSMLRAIPVHNTAARIEQVPGSQNTCLSVPVVKPKWVVPPVSWFFKPRNRKTYEIDPVGMFVWERCNGTDTVETIIDAFAARYALTFHESRVSVTEYIRRLIRRGMLAIMMNE
jgi:hypothetical protein